LPGNKNAEPGGKRNDKCLYLQSEFPHPDRNRGNENTGYLFWADNRCKRTRKHLTNGFRYLCEMEKNNIEDEHDKRISQVTDPEQGLLKIKLYLVLCIIFTFLFVM